jgi:hypothetical protein
MQLSFESARTPETSNCPPDSAHLVYDLRLTNGRSDCFYGDVARFSDQLLAQIELHAGAAIDGYSRHLQIEMREPPRSRGEYGIEFLMLGLVLRQYAGAAQITQGWILKLTRGLFRLRGKSGWMKAVTDRLRAVVTGFFLVPKIGRVAKPDWRPLRGLPSLIEWLRATGEFEQETARLDNWRSYLGTLPEAESKRWMEASLELFDWFQAEAEKALGSYTRGVPRFLLGEHRRRGWREDQILCGKEPVEYHLNMVAFEIMNRGLREEFEQTHRKAVLVPACMRGARASTCRAHVNGTDIRCAACDPTCPVNQIRRRMKSQGVEVFLVPHSTGFSRWLERWQREPDCGVAAVACILNIMTGGYEMRARGIASQCLLLDYPGCQKHWRREGLATALNEERLVHVVSASANQ